LNHKNGLTQVIDLIKTLSEITKLPSQIEYEQKISKMKIEHEKEINKLTTEVKMKDQELKHNDEIIVNKDDMIKLLKKNKK